MRILGRPRGIGAFFFAVAFSLLVTASAFAGDKEGIVLFGDDGRVYFAGPRDKQAKALPDAEFDTIAGRNDHIRTVGADTRIQGDGKVAVRLHDAEDDEFATIERLEPPKKGQYVTAHRDLNGDLYVELDLIHNGGGFVFYRPGARETDKPVIVPPSKQQWADDSGRVIPTPKFPYLVANTNGSGLVGVLDNEVVHVLPPTREERTFRITKIGIPDGKKVMLAGGEIFVQRDDGNLARVKLTGGSWQVTDVGKPSEDLHFRTALSTGSGKPGESARAFRTPSKAPAGLSETPLPDGQFIKFDKDTGRELKYEANGTLIAPPKESFEEVVAKHPELRDFLRIITRDLTYRFAYDSYLGRERIYDESRIGKMTEMLEILIAPENNSPVVLGEAGVGKTALVEMLAQYTHLGRLPEAKRFELDLHGGVWIETSAAMISLLQKSNDASAQALAVSQFDEMARNAQKKLKKPLVIFIDEMHMLSEAQRNAFKPLLARQAGPVRYVWGTTPDQYRLMVRYDQATERRTPGVLIDEFDVPTTRNLLKSSLVPRLSRYFAGADGKPATITDDAIEQILRRAREYEPNTAFPAGPIVLANHVVAHAHRMAGKEAPVVDGPFVSRFVKEKMGLKFDPASPDFVAEIDAVRGRLKAKVIDQGPLIDKIVDMFEDVVDDESGRPHRFLLVSGSTGVGKSYGAEEAGAELVGKQRVLTIDCTQFSGAGNNIDLIMNKLLGAPPGVLSSDKFIGILPEFLSGRGRGVNVIVWDEVDKMDPQAFKKLMEMFDKGVITGGDGKQYRLGRSVNVMTTNKGASHIFPRGRAGRAIRREELEKRLASFTDDIKKWFLEPSEHDLYDKSMMLPPEVVQRIHDAIGMLPPTVKGAEFILRKVAVDVGDVVKETKGYSVVVDDEVVAELVKARYSPENGLREPKRQLVEAMNSARRLLRRKTNGVIPPGAAIRLRLVKGERGEASTILADLVVEEKVVHTVTTAGVNLRSVVDVLRDPVKRKLLKDLPENLKKRVFGQDEMIQTLVQLVRNQWANPAIKDPVSALFLGPTGTGKTELAKALAQELFGSEDRALLLPMGGVDHPWDLSEIFNPPRGVRGSEGINRFEAFLRANRGIGGVVVLDEIGNMGGGDPKQKAKLLKQFFEMLDEGVYTNKVTGEVYDLREFVFIMTSNEGQEEFEGVPADDMRNAIYAEINNEDKLAEMLIKSHGWPPALVARVNALALARPLSKETRASIAKKFLQGTHAAIAEVSGIVEFKADEAFYKGFGESFFTHERGARRMRVMIEKKDVADLVTQARLMLDPDDVEGSTFEFKLRDTYANRYRFIGALPDPREVEVTLVVTKNGRELGKYSSGNIAERAAPRILQSEIDIDRTAAHEAGHAVANLPRDTGKRLEYITVQGEGTALGYARYKSLRSKYSVTRDEAISRIAYILAGNAGQMLKKHQRDSGWSKDLEMARQEAERAVAIYGLSDETLELPTENGKVTIKDRVVQKEIAKLMSEGARMAHKRLIERSAMFEAVYQQLKTKETITAAEFDAMERKLEGKVSTGADDGDVFGAGITSRQSAEECWAELVAAGERLE